MTNPNATLADELEAKLQYLIDHLSEAQGSRDADCGYVTGKQFQMMTMCPDPEGLADAINALPTILAALRTPAPAIVTEALKYADMEICRHEETHRGGVLWTICDACGMKWADDQGGFKPSPWPDMYDKAIAALRTNAHLKGEAHG